MTNTIALYLVLLIAAAMTLDYVVNDSNGLLFMAREFLDLMEWVIFWD